MVDGQSSRTILPIPDVPHVGLTTYDAKDPDTSYPPIKDVRPPEAAPNVLVILIDDVGFGASSAFGGPCQTPNFEKLASGGLKYTRFHTTALCSPTRQALLTGRNHHSVGMGNITETATAAPGYTSVLPNTKAPLALTLKLNGYSTAQFGKCHEVPVWQTSPAGPFTAWPTGGGGFEYFYGFIGGENNQWDPALYEGTTPIEPPKTPAEGYHLTEDLTDKAINWVRQQKALLPDKPFFMYFAPGATHAPHHVPQGVDRQVQGQVRPRLGQAARDHLRAAEGARRHPRRRRADAAPRGDPGLGRHGSCAQAGAGARDGGVRRILGAHRPSRRPVARCARDPYWTTRWSTSSSATTALGGGHAAGRVQRDGQLQRHGRHRDTRIPDVQARRVRRRGFLRPLRGRLGVGDGYAYQWTKQVASHWGGTRNGTIVHWPKGIEDKGGMRNQFSHVIDLAPDRAGGGRASRSRRWSTGSCRARTRVRACCTASTTPKRPSGTRRSTSRCSATEAFTTRAGAR